MREENQHDTGFSPDDHNTPASANDPSEAGAIPEKEEQTSGGDDISSLPESEPAPAPMTFRDLQNEASDDGAADGPADSGKPASLADDLLFPPFSLPTRPKKMYLLKSLLWILSVVLVAFGIFVVFQVMTQRPKEEQKDNSLYIPDNSYAASSYAEEESIPGAPKVSADPNGPQISAVEASSPSGSESSLNAAYQKASPSIVCVTSYSGGDDYVLNKLGDGSGIIISSDGYIATNSHVVDDSKETGVMITLYDGTQYLGTIIGVDKKTDLAVLKIDAKDLTPAEFASSDSLFVGQVVYAIGNPGGSNFSNSLTKGIVSALNRILSNNGYVKYIQTDAAINPGNSGGALINESGQVVGMNTSKIVSEKYESMGFSIPCSKVIEVVNQLIKYGYVNDRGTLGIEGATCNLYESKRKNVPCGMVITKIDMSSPLLATEIKEQDIITEVNGVRVKSAIECIEQLSKYKPGDTITLTVFRAASETTRESTFTESVKLAPEQPDVSQP